jgi:CTP:molybdopterin cytidylyltransferase MocA
LSVESGSLSAVVLAAGQSTRTINQNKLLSLVNGTAIVVGGVGPHLSARI